MDIKAPGEEGQKPIEVFCCYAREDQQLLLKLTAHLASLQREGLITLWADTDINAGAEWENEIHRHLNTARIILLLVSSDFMVSDYCYSIEMQRAMVRHECGEACVIPIILRPVSWQKMPFGTIQALPTGGKPITSEKWLAQDAAFLDVVEGIRRVVDELHSSTEKNFSKEQARLQKRNASSKFDIRIPWVCDPFFEERSGEFEHLEQLLLAPPSLDHPRYVGVIGIGGIGKTQLVTQLAYRFFKENRFPGGIFGIPANGGKTEWISRLADLAERLQYLPDETDGLANEKELKRTQHFCRYLSTQHDVLLILDNVDDPLLITSLLPELAEEELQCAILYTSRIHSVPDRVKSHPVMPLSERSALNVLLKPLGEGISHAALEDHQDTEVQAACSICQYVEYLPLALKLLREILKVDQHTSLTSLAHVLRQRGAMSITQDIKEVLHSESLPSTFSMSYERIDSESARQLFLLASCFPEAAPIPLWLLGLALDLGEQGSFHEQLGKAQLELQRLGLLESLNREYVQLHPLLHAFGQWLLRENAQEKEPLLVAARAHLVAECTNIYKLEKWVQEQGYQICHTRIREAYSYMLALADSTPETLEQVKQIGRIERWLARESHLFTDTSWWPNSLPGLFFQQFYNRLVDAQLPTPTRITPQNWIRLSAPTYSEDPALLRIFTGHRGRVYSVAFAPDTSQQILTGSDEGIARVIDIKTDKVLQRFALPTAGDKKRKSYEEIFHGDHDTSTSLQGRKIRRHYGISSVAFSPDGRYVLIGSADDATAYLWERNNSGKPIRCFQGHHEAVRCVAFSPDGRYVLTGSLDKTARVWNYENGKELRCLRGHSGAVNSVAFSPNGHDILTGANDRLVCLWQRGQQVWSRKDHTKPVQCVAFSPDGRYVLSGSFDATVRLWDRQTGEPLRCFIGHASGVDSVTFSLDGAYIIAGGYDSTVRIWDVHTGEITGSLTGHTSDIRSLALSPDGQYLLTGSSDNTARLWDFRHHRDNNRLMDKHGINRVTFLPGTASHFLVSSYDGTVSLWKQGEPREKNTQQEIKMHQGRVDGLVFSPNGKLAASGGADQKICLWTIQHVGSSQQKNQNYNLSMQRILSGHEDRIYSVAFSPDSRFLLSGSYDRTARLWRVDTGKEIACFKGHDDQIRCVAYSPDGQYVLTGSSDTTARLWDVSTAQEEWRLIGHTAKVNYVAFSPDGKTVLTCAYDATARLWDRETQQQIACFTGHADTMRWGDFSPDGQVVIVSDAKGWFYFLSTQRSEQGRLLGVSMAMYKVAAVHWNGKRTLVLADKGGPHLRPHFYDLTLEGFE